MSAAAASRERRAALVVREATLTFAMTHPRTGRSFSPAEIKEPCELVLAGRFARVVGVDECLRDLGEADA